MTLSVQTDNLPPTHADRERNENAQCYENEVDLIEARTFEITLTEIDRTRTAGVFRDTPHRV